MSLSAPKIVLPETPPPIPPPPLSGEDTVRGVSLAKKPKSAKKNPLLLGDAPMAAPAVGSSPTGIFGGSPGGLAIP